MKRILCYRNYADNELDDDFGNTFLGWHHALDPDDYCEVTDEEYEFLRRVKDEWFKAQAMLEEIDKRRVTVFPEELEVHLSEDVRPSALCAERFAQVFALQGQDQSQ